MMKLLFLTLIGGLLLMSLACGAATDSLSPFLWETLNVNPSTVASNADRFMTLPIATMVDKPQPSPTGDPHDYISYARYWWPDPSSSNGLPFIRRDGHQNRQQMALGDRARLGQMIDGVTSLAQAWHFEHRETCAVRAGEWVRAWFVTPATRMNPSLDYAQIRLGHDQNHGSNWGLIDTHEFPQLIDGLRLLHGSPAFAGRDENLVRQWFAHYLRWLTTSENGRLEHATTNNHGSWYLAQVISIARYLERDEQARQFAREDFARIANQFKPDGSQPLEIARADGLGYSVFNLRAQFEVAELAEPIGVDLWRYVATNGASLRRGVEFLLPYNTAPATWPYSQLKELKPGFLQPLLDQAASIWPDLHAAPPAPAPAKPTGSTAPATRETTATPASLPGAETHIYREGSPEPMRLHVFKPKNWKAGDHRPGFIFFFGGGWTRGTPERSAGWARYAASLGFVGVAPDYRTRERFDTSPLESVADGRAALRWVQDHATELGINPEKIVVGGSSSGGHVALWTAITHSPPGSDPNEAPTAKPAALILVSPVSDTSTLSGYTPYRFGTNAMQLSPFHQLDPQMPPVLVFHGDADTTVPNRQSIALHDKLVSEGNVCELVTVPDGTHHFTSELPEWKGKCRIIIREFLSQQGLLPGPE